MSENQFETLQTRILIRFKTGKEIMYIYNKEVLDQLGIEREPYDNSLFISIGNIITVDEEKYKVVDINFRLEPQLYTPDNLGISMYSEGGQSAFNSQVGVFVERVE
jgi:hypothetical protein